MPPVAKHSFHVHAVGSMMYEQNLILHVRYPNIEIRRGQLPGAILLALNMHHIRNYGQDKGQFVLEAGRRCPGGPGIHVFQMVHPTDVIVPLIEQQLAGKAVGSVAAAPTDPSSPGRGPLHSRDAPRPGRAMSASQRPSTKVPPALRAARSSDLTHMASKSRSPETSMRPDALVNNPFANMSTFFCGVALARGAVGRTCSQPAAHGRNSYPIAFCHDAPRTVRSTTRR